MAIIHDKSGRNFASKLCFVCWVNSNGCFHEVDFLEYTKQLKVSVMKSTLVPYAIEKGRQI